MRPRRKGAGVFCTPGPSVFRTEISPLPSLAGPAPGVTLTTTGEPRGAAGGRCGRPPAVGATRETESETRPVDRAGPGRGSVAGHGGPRPTFSATDRLEPPEA